MLEFKGCWLEVKLEAQSPMIHFQANKGHPGVTVRASEVKPKLDKFLIRKLQKRDGIQNVEQIKKKYSSFFIDSTHNALNYKMKMEMGQHQQSSLIDLSSGKKYKYELYYGNLGKEGDEKKMGVLSNPSVLIFCVIADLRILIQEYIIEFFIVTNFGAMQNKGFGSFLPNSCKYASVLKTEQEKEIAEYLLEDIVDSMKNRRNCKKSCYSICFNEIRQNSRENKNADYVEMFKEINRFYKLVKSGYCFQGKYIESYIHKYMHQKNIGNETEWMEQQGLSFVRNKSDCMTALKTGQKKDWKYVRAMLGTSEKLDGAVKVSSFDKEIERVSSPIYFKVIKNVVFIVAREIPEKIYGLEYRFWNRDAHKEGRLKTPDEFDIDEFLEKYVDYYNNLLKNKNSGIKGKREVEVVKCVTISELQ